MRWGLIARSETDRGLGIQTLSMYQQLKPDRTLVVVNHKSGFASHPELYPDATFVDLQHGPDKNRLDEATVRDWMSGLDAVLTVETLYDWDLVPWAEDAGAVTIVHGNPEFALRDANSNPDVWWWPTSWRPHDHMPAKMIVVPVPVDRTPVAPGPLDMPVKFVHVHGSGAINDRNGTAALLSIKGAIPNPRALTISTQEPIGESYTRQGFRVVGPTPDRWSIYEGQHVLVLPRRYGGLCLPAIEAMASGLAVVMTDTAPNRSWPIVPVAVHSPGQKIHVQAANIMSYQALPGDLRNVMRQLAAVPKVTQEHRLRAHEWALANTWDQHRQTYYDCIDEAVQEMRRNKASKRIS